MKPTYNWIDEVSNIRNMGIQGKTLQEIGSHYGVTNVFIRKLIKEHGIFDDGVLYGAKARAKAKREAKHQRLFLKRGIKEDTDLYKAKRAKFKIKKSNTKRAGIEFTINYGELEWPEYCPVLGIKLDYFVKGGVPSDYSPSFDRLDSTKGYIRGNVLIMSHRANRIKNNATIDEVRKLLEWYEKAIAA